MTSPDNWLEMVLAELLAAGPRKLTLDEIGTALGRFPASPADVEELFGRLEKAGALVGEATGEDLSAMLKVVLLTAKALKAEGVRPDPRAIAERSGMSPRAVRVALLYADVLRGG